VVLTREEALRQPILAPDVEMAHIRAWKDVKSEKAIDAITRSYYRLCFSIASQYTKNPSQMEDLAQEGSFGIKKAVEKYDPEKGTKFSTYSRLWIQNFIAAKASSVLNDITVPSRAYIDAKMGRLPPGKNDKAVFAAMPFVALDAPIGDGEGSGSVMDNHVCDNVTPESILEADDLNAAMRGLVGEALSHLTEREVNVITRRKLKDTPDTLEEISEDFGVTRERIRQIEMTAMEKMKHILSRNGFDARRFFEA
jgi:RNA polymerase sigma-32 factor